VLRGETVLPRSANSPAQEGPSLGRLFPDRLHGPTSQEGPSEYVGHLEDCPGFWLATVEQGVESAETSLPENVSCTLYRMSGQAELF
jgi:hypothetical protein